MTIHSDWYQNFLLLANPASDLIVINSDGSILLSANDTLNGSYMNYYQRIQENSEYGYLLDDKGKEICMYYQSPSTGHLYLRITSVQELVPRLFHFRKIAVCFIAGLSFLFAVLLLALFIFSFFPMLRMKDTIKRVDRLLTGENKTEASLKEQLENVVSKSERANHEQIFYDMLSKKRPSDASELFKTPNASYGLMLIAAHHRKDIYAAVPQQYSETVVTKSDNIYACVGTYPNEESFAAFSTLISKFLQCRVFVSFIFTNFHELVIHFQNLKELQKLSLILNDDQMITQEQELKLRKSENTITTKDFTELSVRLKSGNIDSSLAKWNEILEQMKQYRYEPFQYIIYRTEDILCQILKEMESDLLNSQERLLPDTLDQIKSLEEINTVFHQAFTVICDNYSERKAQRYSDLAEKVREIIQEEYHDPALNAQFIADRLNMNSAYLGRMFRSSYGNSINYYINVCRLEESKLLLKQCDDSIDNIAKQVGFSNIKYFYVLFKRYTNLTPSAFRSGT